jgi:phenylacetate-CoA ligase
MRQAYWSRSKLTDFQDRKVRAIVKYAFEYSRFYNERFKQLGLRPDDVKGVRDLNKLPIFRRGELQKNAEKIVSDKFDIDGLEVDRTSGSSGQPLLVYLCRKEDEFRKAKMLRANISCGQRLRDRWLVITSPRHQSKQVGLQKLLGVYSPFSVSVFENLATQFSIIEKFKPDIIEGYSSSLVLLASEIERMGIQHVGARLIIGGAELVDEPSRSFVERIFGAPFYDQYASVELEAMAWQCVEKSGYHVDADSVVMQFVDEEGEEVAPGERGEIVCTSLFNYAMPFIRYAIGDVGISSDEECTCGRGFPLMKMIEGRKDSFVRLPDGRLVSPRNFTIAMSTFSLYDQVDRFRVVQKRRDVVEYIVKLKNGVADSRSLALLLEAHVTKTLRLEESGVKTVVRFADDIPLDKGGKLKAVVSDFKS